MTPSTTGTDLGTALKTSAPLFFRTPSAFREWLKRNHRKAQELRVGFHKSGSGLPSMTWPESVDEALCFGWIDGVRKRVDDVSYTIRFTPRKPGGIWSAINIRRAQTLIEQGRMGPAGIEAFQRRRENRSGVYSYEQRPDELTAPYAGMLAKNTAASQFFRSQPPSYRRAATWWVISAKKEETRLKRATTLIELSARRELIPQFSRKPSK
jgi:uncharacterized protein YdeI (YjbR/CyaY-like superfamily)